MFTRGGGGGGGILDSNPETDHLPHADRDPRFNSGFETYIHTYINSSVNRALDTRRSSASSCEFTVEYNL